ncbi:c-type cytochrome [Bradyrhizobium prioriisuperbiae]|uniref:c-type cytochrome n=1 Tax=Bradyrhizobium prioriisuperbiae TaxID=2854389 RepID=UPI003898E923
MRRCLPFFGLPLFALMLSGLLLQSATAAPDVAAIKDKLELCAGCHGKEGISETPNTPSLAGQPDQFLQWQLIYFRSGARANELMGPISADLSNEDVRNLAGYFAALPPPPAATSDDNPALSEAGAKIAAQNRCTSCHTDTYAGTKAVARVARQREDYLLKALMDYKAGTRTGGGVAAMADVTYPLKEDELKALAHYLANYK